MRAHTQMKRISKILDIVNEEYVKDRCCLFGIY